MEEKLRGWARKKGLQSDSLTTKCRDNYSYKYCQNSRECSELMTIDAEWTEDNRKKSH